MRRILPLAGVIGCLLSSLTVWGGADPSVRVLSHGNESCRVDLMGGRVVSYQVDGTELLWYDDPPQRTAKDWAHGGIPICWPWFGVDGKGDIHGTAWRRRFTQRKEWASDVACGMELGLREGDLELTYEVKFGNGLMLDARVRNHGTTNCTFTLGFHPYFRAENRDLVTVSGLDGRSFEDDPSFPRPEKGVWHGVVLLTNYVDRIFAMPTNDVSVCVRGISHERDLELTFRNFTGVNVWNPGPEKNCPGVIPGDAWRRFICVEPIRCGTNGEIRLAPQEEMAFLFMIRSLKR